MPQLPKRRSSLLPPLAWLEVFTHMDKQTINTLMCCSFTFRREILLCAKSLRFTPGVKAAGQLSRQLCSLLQERSDPLRLVVDMSKGPANAEAMAVLLAEAAGTSRREPGAAGTSCVAEILVEVRKSACSLSRDAQDAQRQSACSIAMLDSHAREPCMLTV